MAIFSTLIYGALSSRIANHLLEAYPEACEDLPPVWFAARIDAAIEAAAGFGIISERAIAEFVTKSFLIGPDFHRHPRVNSLLNDESIEPDFRVGLIGILLTSDELREAGA